MRTALFAATAVSASLVLAAPAQAQDPNLGRNLAATCANCHGTGGVSNGEIASLAGVRKDEIVRRMQEFREGKRAATIMHQIAKGYTATQVELIAAWFAAQKSGN